MKCYDSFSAKIPAERTNLIKLIKGLRNMAGLSLKEAKDAVELMLDQHRFVIAVEASEMPYPVDEAWEVFRLDTSYIPDEAVLAPCHTEEGKVNKLVNLQAMLVAEKQHSDRLKDRINDLNLAVSKLLGCFYDLHEDATAGGELSRLVADLVNQSDLPLPMFPVRTYNWG